MCVIPGGGECEQEMNNVLCIYFCSVFFFKKDFVHLFSERGEGREREEKGRRQRGRETMIGCLSHAPDQRSGPQPTCVP